jgi:hypothetical protein
MAYSSQCLAFAKAAGACLAVSSGLFLLSSQANLAKQMIVVPSV